VLVPAAELGHAQLVRSVEASGAALAAALVVGGTMVHVRTGAFVPAATIARTGLALGACVAAGLYLPRASRLQTPLLALAVAVGYVAILLITREIGPNDLAMVRNLGSKRKAG
jgi:stage V sporulation protein B